MRDTQTAQRLLRLALVIVLAVAILAAGSVTIVKMKAWRVEWAMDRFRTAPTGEHAHLLIQWLARSGRDPRAGRAHPYASSTPRNPDPSRLSHRTICENQCKQAPPYQDATGPDRIDAAGLGRRAGVRLTPQQIWADGWEVAMGTRYMSTKTLSGSPGILPAWPAPRNQEFAMRRSASKAGSRRPTSSHSVGSALRTTAGTTPGPARVGFTCPKRTDLRVPFHRAVQINIVEPDQAERLELIANPQIDETMRAAITTKTSGRGGDYGKRRPAKLSRLHDRHLRASGRCGCLRAIAAAADGHELPQGTDRQHQHIRLRSGDYGEDFIDMWGFAIEEPDEYTGKLVLRPDPDYAYEDPAIKSIWNGTLEFPISFSVYAGTRTR